MRATASFSLSGSFVTLLIWAGCTTVICLVDETLSVQPATTIGYHSTEVTIANATQGKHALPFDCGNNSHTCMDYCDICWDHFGRPNKECLSVLLHYRCLLAYEDEMKSLNSTDWCIWSRVSGFYSKLSLCTETISDCLLIPWPNSLVEETFVRIHSEFFKDCPTEELSDPPPVIVFALVITPICLIPVMVSLVVLKTKNGDGSS